jgi:hypothetical protein
MAVSPGEEDVGYIPFTQKEQPFAIKNSQLSMRSCFSSDHRLSERPATEKG